MKNLLKIKKFIKEGSLLSQCFFAISYVVEGNFGKILKNASRIEDAKEAVNVVEEGDKLIVKINNTKLTPNGLVVEIDDEKEEYTNHEYLKEKLFSTLRDIFQVCPPNQKYFSLKFKEILRKDFTF